MKSTLVVLTVALAGTLTLSAQGNTQPSMNAMHMQKDQAAQKHDHRDDAMNHRGDQAMGFDQSKTTHHFLLAKDGGAIAVSANSPDDTASANQIRQHLEHISHTFAAGDFDIPMFVHDQVPPGVPAMKRLKDKIGYSYEKSERGARVVIRSGNAEAVEAIHEFLRFQITEHKTGDPLSIQ